jgi:hypothetical protein
MKDEGGIKSAVKDTGRVHSESNGQKKILLHCIQGISALSEERNVDI